MALFKLPYSDETIELPSSLDGVAISVKATKDGRGSYIVLTDDDRREIIPINLERAGDGSKTQETGFDGAGLWVCNWYPARFLVFGEGYEGALEEMGGFCADEMRGVFLDQDYMKECAEDARKEINEERAKLGKAPLTLEEERDSGEVYDRAMQDLTYTESGYLPSDYWGDYRPAAEVLSCCYKLALILRDDEEEIEELPQVPSRAT